MSFIPSGSYLLPSGTGGNITTTTTVSGGSGSGSGVTQVATLPSPEGASNLGKLYFVPGVTAGTPDKYYAGRYLANQIGYTYTRLSGRSLILKMCSADFTPPGLGIDIGGLVIIPFDPEEAGAKIPITWYVTDIIFRIETPASAGLTSLKIQRYVGTGTFTNTGYLNTTSLDIAVGAYEAPAASLAVTQVTSGDKLRPEFTAIGTNAAGFTAYVILRESL